MKAYRRIKQRQDDSGFPARNESEHYFIGIAQPERQKPQPRMFIFHGKDSGDANGEAIHNSHVFFKELVESFVNINTDHQNMVDNFVPKTLNEMIDVLKDALANIETITI